MQNRDGGCLICRYIGFGICAVVFGIPALLFLAAITWGAILIPGASLLMLAPLALANYLLGEERPSID